MPNMKAIITGHNKKLLKNESSQQSKPCNCKNKDICPLKRFCRQLTRVGLFLLHELSTIIPKEPAGLYRDDGLAILRNSSSPNTD